MGTEYSLDTENLKFKEIVPVIEKMVRDYHTDVYMEFDMTEDNTYKVLFGVDEPFMSDGNSKKSLAMASYDMIEKFLNWYSNQN